MNSLELRCSECGYTWRRGGSLSQTTCPNCRIHLDPSPVVGGAVKFVKGLGLFVGAQVACAAVLGMAAGVGYLLRGISTEAALLLAVPTVLLLFWAGSVANKA